MVTQLEVARRAGVDVSTVNKILHRKPGPKFHRATIAKVFKSARSLHYPVDALKHAHRRTDNRRTVNLHCEVTIYRGAIVHDKGTAMLRELSTQGARIGNISTAMNTLPLEPFTIGIRPLGWELELQGTLIRFHASESLSLGIALLPLDKRGEMLLLKFVGNKKGP